MHENVSYSAMEQAIEGHNGPKSLDCLLRIKYFSYDVIT